MMSGERLLDAPPCPDTINGWHGPADAKGRCPWCGTTYMTPRPRPKRFEGEPESLSTLDEAYAMVYDPDWS